MVGARTLFIMGDLDLQGHDLDHQGHNTLDDNSRKIQATFTIFADTHIMVGARTLFILGDLDLHLQGHDLDLQGHNTLSAQ